MVSLARPRRFPTVQLSHSFPWKRIRGGEERLKGGSKIKLGCLLDGQERRKQEKERDCGGFQRRERVNGR